MSSRIFEKTSINVPGARPQTAHMVTCCKCGATEKASITAKNGGVMASEVIAARFRNMGWTISSRGNADVCPVCQEKKKAERKNEQKESNVVEFKAEPPRMMGKEDARVIFAKLNDVYLDEETGYSKGWTDAKVAEDLGVPAAWVTGVREQYFGKEGCEPESTALLNKLKDEAAKMDELRLAYATADKRIATIFAETNAKMAQATADAEKAGAAFQRQVDLVFSLIGEIEKASSIAA